VIKISLSKIDAAGIDVEGSESPAFLEMSDPARAVASSDVTYKVHVSLVTGGVLVKGTASAAFDAVCGRCLKKIRFDVTDAEVCHLVEGSNLTEIDITDEIREDILIELPQYFLCAEDCPGLCPVCGAALAAGKCGCRPKKEEKDLVPPESVWKELDNIKVRRRKR
jgi:uncharacterized metal-binding protein YceD (DUF177 family)